VTKDELFDCSTKLWEALLTGSRTEGDTLVWEGSLLTVANELDMPRASYHRAIRALKDVDSIRPVRSGNRFEQTKINLVESPTRESFDLVLTNRRPPARLEQRVNDLVTLVGGVNIAEALAEIDQRLTKLERGDN
jgi:hypothetical protein